MKKLQLFDQNHGLTPLEKCHFCAFLDRRFRFSEQLVCYIKRRISFFVDLFSGSMTWEYRGYRGLQGVTRGDKLKKSHIFDEGERSKILFLGLFCIKIKLKKSQIFDENDGLTRLEKC